VLDPGSYELFVQLHGHAGLSNAGAAPDEYHLAVEGHTESLRPERDGCLLFICSSGVPYRFAKLAGRTEPRVST
jgi:hypothetical protein